MKQAAKAGCALALVLLLGAGMYIVNAFWGNPVSAWLARRSAERYLDEHYAHLDIGIDRFGYSFKTSDYYAHVSSPASVDTHFTVYMRMNGEVRYDTYDSVTDGWNTWQRLEEAYRTRVSTVLDAPDFELRNDIAFGTLEIFEESVYDYRPIPYGIKTDELVCDGEYDPDALAASAGHIIFYMQDEEVSFENAAKGMLRLKSILDEARIPFFAMDFVLRLPRGEGQPGNGGPVINVREFLRSDMEADGLVERVRTAHEALEAYYAEQDKFK